MRKKINYNLIPFVILIIFSFFPMTLLAQSQNCQSLSDTADVTGPTFTPTFNTAPDIPNPTVTSNNPVRIRVAGTSATAMTVSLMTATTWEVRATVSGLTAMDPAVQYSDVRLINLMVTGTMIPGIGSATLQAPYSTGTVTFADIQSNPLVLSGVGSTHGSSMAQCTNAMNGAGNTYWTLDFDVEFMNDYFFDSGAYSPQVQLTLMCLTNCI